MIEMLEVVSDKVYKCSFVDLFVRYTSIIAIKMYEGLGYSVFKRLQPFYGLERRCSVQYSLLTKYLELDMRKPLTRDPKRRSVRPNGRDINVSAREVS